MTQTIAGPIQSGWTPLPGTHKHPADNALGALVRNDKTGIYCLAMGGTMRSVPQRWAQEAANATV